LKALTRNQKSLINTDLLLQEIIKDPQNFSGNETLISALSSQSSLAKHKDVERFISAVSLNTFKTIANELIPGGFLSVDRRRMRARELLQLAPIRGAQALRTKKSLEQKVALLELQIQQYEYDLSHLSRAFWRALSEARSYAKRSGDALLIAECAQNEEVIRGMASLMSRKVMESVK